MRYILITDVQYRKTFDVISIILNQFPKEYLLLGSAMSKLFTSVCYGKIETIKLRTDEGYSVFFEDMETLQERYSGCDIVYLPIEETTTDYFVRYMASKVKHLVKWLYLLPSAELYTLFRNKESLNRFCLLNNLPSPKMYTWTPFCNKNQSEAWEFPVILKPTIGSGSRGIYRLTRIEDISPEIILKLNNESYLIQELIPNGNQVEGAFFLCEDGEILGAYTHERIRTYPEDGGVTVLSRMQYNSDLIEIGHSLLKQVKWSGLVMLEYLWDEKNHSYKLIEANPRLWGSVMLSEYGGAYLLTNYIRRCIGMPLKSMQVDSSKFIRWLFPMDIFNLLRSKFKIHGFWNFKDTCFINWTYASKYRAIVYMFFNTFNIDNIKKIIYRK